MENYITIKAESRQTVGKKIAKKLRRENKIPAIIYGDHKESIPISLLVNDVKLILKTEKGENAVLKIQRDDIEVDAMLKEIQWDYLSDNIIHADFIRLDLEKAVYVSIPVHPTGEAIGVRVEDGIFDFVTREIKIKCLPFKIPTEYIVDVSDMHIGNSLKAESLELGDGVQLISDPHTVICSVAAKGKVEEVEEGEEGEEGVEGVITADLETNLAE